MQLFSYELRQINAIDHKCDGQMRRPKPTEIDTLAMHYHNASIEMEGHDFSMEDCKKIITGYMQNDELFVWVDDNDEIIATVQDGIYVTDVGGLHAGLNPISGDFNVQGTGFVIKNGKIDRQKLRQMYTDMQEIQHLMPENTIQYLPLKRD